MMITPEKTVYHRVTESTEIKHRQIPFLTPTYD